MRKVFLLVLFILVILLEIDSVAANEIDNQLPSLVIDNNFVSLTYKTGGINGFTYTGVGTVNCNSSDTDYVKCSVDSAKKQIVLTPIKATNKDVVITVSAGDSTKMIKNNANIQYDGEDEINLQELVNPVVKVESMDIDVPNTGSKVAIFGVCVGTLLLGFGGYSIYRKFHA